MCSLPHLNTHMHMHAHTYIAHHSEFFVPQGGRKHGGVGGVGGVSSGGCWRVCLVLNIKCGVCVCVYVCVCITYLQSSCNEGDIVEWGQALLESKVNIVQGYVLKKRTWGGAGC